MGGLRCFSSATRRVGGGTAVEGRSATLAIKASNVDDETPLRKLKWSDVEVLLDEGLLRLPRPSEIQDKSKSDWISKSLVLIQITWFITQCIGRSAQHLPLTELEVVTLAYTVVNVIIYVAWWEKPYHVAEPVRVYANKERVWGYNDAGRRGSIFATIIAGSVFGAMHFIAWASFFPTRRERLLWRIATIVLTGVPLLALPSAFVLDGLDVLISGLSGLWICVYIICRAVILVLAFTTLRRLPPEAYRNVEWSDLFPHI